jgi:hypothetical protein
MSNIIRHTGASVLDDLLIKAAAGGKSGTEMERATGIPAAQAVVHVKQLLASRNIWTEHEQRQLLLAELNQLKDVLTENALKSGDLDTQRLLLKALETIGKRLDAQQQDVDANTLKLTQFQEKILLRAMDAALSFAKSELQERYPQITRGELEEIVAQGLLHAKDEIVEESELD